MRYALCCSVSMAKIIPFQKKRTPSPTLITAKPFEFRMADWESVYFVQMLKSESEKLDHHRKEVHDLGGAGVWHLPPHYVLRGGMECTMTGLYRNRENEERMREAYYLAGLVDCMVNQVNPLLRTGLIHDIYQKVATLRSILRISWYGPIDQVLFPLDSLFFNEAEYRGRLALAREISELYRVIRQGTEEMFDILSLEYCFYIPGRNT
jgi:hypothetical protein